MSNRQDIYSDLYKDAYGVRPGNFIDLDSMDVDTFQDVLDHLETTIIENIADESSRELKAINNLVYNVKKLAKKFDINNETSLRWLMDAEGEDPAWFFYNNGISTLAGEQDALDQLGLSKFVA